MIQYCLKLRPKDFMLKTANAFRKRRGKREYLNKVKTKDFVKGLNAYFQRKVDIPRIRVGCKQEIETIIAEEALLFAKYLRNERDEWTPRVVSL